MSKFKNAKVGDKVYCLLYGEGEIINIDANLYYSVEVSFNTGLFRSYSTCGELLSDHSTVVLYWEKPEIIEKKRVRSVTKYRVVYRDRSRELVVSSGFYKSVHDFNTFHLDLKADSIIESTAWKCEEEV